MLRAGVPVALVLLATATTYASVPSADAASLRAEAKALLDAGQAAQALARSAEALEWSPADVELLDLAARSAEAAGSIDAALWYGGLALERAAQTQSKLAEEVRARIAALDPLQRRDEAVLAAYGEALLQLAQRSAAKKLWVNAVDLYARCEGTAAAERAAAELDKIYANKKAVEVLLESGLDVAIKSKKKRTPRETAREDARHALWKQAYTIKGDNYTIVTNLGLDLAEQMSLAMEQMNRFYRKVFHVKERGGDTARVTIKVYRSRAEFDAHEADPDRKAPAPDVQGFFSSGELEVATYDTRADGFPPSQLWSTLFHEASHQFTALIAPGNLIPGWLNEGTASYFEGARLLSNGSVETNLVPESRLEALHALLQHGSPTLHSVVSYFEPGSYEADFYPFGWGLVYFLNNYEDERSVRVYQPLYREYVQAYRSGAKHDVVGRFVEYFVTQAKQPGVASFEDFEKRWKAWILELADLYFGPPEHADKILTRARKQRADGQVAAAIESYRWALRKRPDDPVATAELAEALVLAKQNDAALRETRLAIELLRAVEDPTQPLPGLPATSAETLLEMCGRRSIELDEEIGAGFAAAQTRVAAECAAAAAGYAQAGLPRTALRLCDRALAAGGANREVARLRARIAADADVDTRRWRRAVVSPELAEWRAAGDWANERDSLLGSSAGPSYCTWRADVPERYAFELVFEDVEIEDQGLAGLFFGENSAGIQAVVWMPVEQRIVLAKLAKNKITTVLVVGKVEKERLAGTKLRVEVFRDHVEFFLDDKPAGVKKLGRPELEGNLGVMLRGGRARFGDVRLCY